MIKLSYEKCPKDAIFIDVRSPQEYSESTIPGAINIPVLNDEERAQVGTCYKQVGETEAKRMAIGFIAPRLVDIFNQVVALKEGNHRKLILFCARGGYRSASLSMWLNGIGVGNAKLDGGYKGYRKYILSQLESISENKTFLLLHGKTGVGKTKLLSGLKAKGYPVIDLEGIANHRGSLLGGVGLTEQPSTKAFESALCHELMNIEHDYVIVEAESRRIGKRMIPPSVFAAMQRGEHLYIDAPMRIRAEIILEDYTNHPNLDEQLLGAMENLKRYMSNDDYLDYSKLLEEKDYRTFAEKIMLTYYDPMYNHKDVTFDYLRTFTVDTSVDKTVEDISKWIDTTFRIKDEDA